MIAAVESEAERKDLGVIQGYSPTWRDLINMAGGAGIRLLWCQSKFSRAENTVESIDCALVLYCIFHSYTVATGERSEESQRGKSGLLEEEYLCNPDRRAAGFRLAGAGVCSWVSVMSLVYVTWILSSPTSIAQQRTE